MPLFACILPLCAASLELKHTYKPNEMARYQITMVGETSGTDLKVVAKIKQTYNQAEKSLRMVVESASVKAFGEDEKVGKKPEFLYKVDAAGKVVGGWVPDQRTAIGVAFIPYLLYGRSFESKTEVPFDYSDPTQRGYTIGGSAKWVESGKTNRFEGFARFRGALDEGRPTVVNFSCTFDAKTGVLTQSKGTFSATMLAARPDTSRRPQLSGIQFELKRL